MAESNARDSNPAILVVEDHRETRTFLDMALSDGYTVDCASDATSALEMTRQTDYNLLLVDIALQDTIDGTELVEQLRQRPDYQTTPMIGMTAHQVHDDREAYLQRGFDEFLAKPFFPDELLDTIKRLLQQADESDKSHRPRG